MKKIIITVAALFCTLCAFAQEPEATAAEAVADAAEAIEAAPEAVPAKPKFSSFWDNSLKTNLTVGQTGLFNWAAGGDNTVSLAAYIDGQANFKKDAMFWNNRLQLDYGFLYASSKPILQKSTDRIYLESKWGYQIKDKLFFSANYDFKTQFTTGYNYNSPSADIIAKYGGTELTDLQGKNLRKAWRDAREGVSAFCAPGYTVLALGIDYIPTKWLSISFAPLTGGYTIVRVPQYRKTYGMEMKKGYNADDYALDPVASDAAEYATYVTDNFGGDAAAAEAYEVEHSKFLNGDFYRAARFEFGAQLKIDAKVNVNDNFSYSTQLVLFENYLKDHKAHPCPRINWDNRIDWKIAKYFSFTLTTNLIYDDFVMFSTDRYTTRCNKSAKYNSKYGTEGTINKGAGPLLQFKESVAFGFTYTIATKK